jgi:hypothetical protein
MRYLLTVILSVLLFFSDIPTGYCQPYIDLLNIKFENSPNAGIFRRNNTSNHFAYSSANLDLPRVFKKDSSIFVLNPFGEIWNLHVQMQDTIPDHFHSQDLSLQSVGAAFIFIHPVSGKWGYILSAIPRWNGYQGRLFQNSFQMGGAVLITYKKRQDLQYKLGLYYNSEFSGPFFVPLFGIYWQMDKRNSLFGIMPGKLTYEHKLNKMFFYGAAFRAITNSYKTGTITSTRDENYVRIDENQITVYADFYPIKRVVLNFEAGHSVFRRVRFGDVGGKPGYYFIEKMNDDIVFSVSLAYRIRN